MALGLLYFYHASCLVGVARQPGSSARIAKYCVVTMQKVKRNTRRENERRRTFAMTGTSQETIGVDAALEKTDIDTLVAQRVSPGMLVLAPPIRVLYMNHQARELLRQLPNGEQAKGHAR